MYTPPAFAQLTVSTQNIHPHPCLSEDLKWLWFPLFSDLLRVSTNEAAVILPQKGSDGFCLLSFSAVHSSELRRVIFPRKHHLVSTHFTESLRTFWYTWGTFCSTDALHQSVHRMVHRRVSPVSTSKTARGRDGPQNKTCLSESCFDITPSGERRHGLENLVVTNVLVLRNSRHQSKNVEWRC